MSDPRDAAPLAGPARVDAAIGATYGAFTRQRRPLPSSLAVTWTRPVSSAACHTFAGASGSGARLCVCSTGERAGAYRWRRFLPG